MRGAIVSPKRLSASFAVAVVPLNLDRRPPATRPLSIRLTAAERQTLEEAAGTMPLSAYVRRRVLNTGMRPQARSARRPSADMQTHGRLLAVLGRARLASSLADLAEAARLGTAALTPEHLVWIKAAHDNLRDIRALLTEALGVAGEERP